MASPIPKEPSQRVRRNKEHRLSLARDGLVRGPEPDDRWCEATVGWWETWRRSIQAQVFEDTDWQRLRMVAGLVERLHTDGRLSANAQTQLVAEVRQNEQKLGATLEDRIKLRLDIAENERTVDPAAEARANVVQMIRGA
jgi:hypothetical protein